MPSAESSQTDLKQTQREKPPKLSFNLHPEGWGGDRSSGSLWIYRSHCSQILLRRALIIGVLLLPLRIWTATVLYIYILRRRRFLSHGSGCEVTPHGWRNYPCILTVPGPDCLRLSPFWVAPQSNTTAFRGLVCWDFCPPPLCVTTNMCNSRVVFSSSVCAVGVPSQSLRGAFVPLECWKVKSVCFNTEWGVKIWWAGTRLNLVFTQHFGACLKRRFFFKIILGGRKGNKWGTAERTTEDLIRFETDSVSSTWVSWGLNPLKSQDRNLWSPVPECWSSPL